MSTPVTTPRQTLDQRRAAHAWRAIQAILKQHPHRMESGKPVPQKEAKNYGGQVKDLPTRILASGLGQALAFRWAKRDAQTETMLRHLGDWVLDKRPNLGSIKSEPDPLALIRQLVAADTDAMFLRRSTDEAIAYLQWLKRFAEGEGLTEGDNA